MDRISNFEIRIPILTIEFGPNIEFWHSKSYFDIRTWTEYRILTFKILFWHSNSGKISIFDIRTRTEYRILTFEILFLHSNSGRISNFDIQKIILKFAFGPNIEFWNSKSYFDIRTWTEYRILTLKILFWHLISGRISNFDIQNLILTFELGPNIEFWHSKCYFDIRIRAKYRILTFKILFLHSNVDRISNFDIRNPIFTFEFRPNIEFWHSKSYFYIQIQAEYRILTFKILFLHSNSGRILNFDIQNLILTFELGPNIECWHSKSYFNIWIRAEYRILIFKILLSYFDIRTWTEYRILTYEILFWHSNSGRISNFDIQNTIDIRIRTEYRILTFKILFWHSNSGRISNFVIQNPILTFELGPNIEFWHSKSYFDIRTWTEYRILTFKILFWHSNLDRISNFDIQNLILTFELGPNIEFFVFRFSFFDIRIRAEYRFLTF